MRTREYVERGESEGKSLVDAMRDGSTEGMQHFDSELDRMVRAGIIDLQTAYAFASNARNLRLQFSDYTEPPAAGTRKPVASRPSFESRPTMSGSAENKPVGSLSTEKKAAAYTLDGMEIER